MNLLFVSFLAGILTILSPCVIPLLPVIIGGSLKEGSRKKAYLITASLAISIVLFTLLLKASTLLINVSPSVWTTISGGLLVALGLITIYPKAWDSIQSKLGLSAKSDELLFKSSQQEGIWGPIFMGAALGPVFSSCSPTYALILATVLPQSFGIGLVNLVIYAGGIACALLALSVGGQKLSSKLGWAVNPKGTFKKVLGIIFVIVGLAIVTGLEKDFETALINNEIFDVTKLEQRLLERNMDIDENDMQDALNKFTPKGSTSGEFSDVEFSVRNPRPAPELQGIVNWINSEPLTMEELKGKVVLIDFWTYSCINCIRTLPYINAWHEKYADKGLVIIGVHAPEFAFEQVRENVENAVNDYGIKYPVAMDNDFKTWRAYNNRYWPAKYFIDKEGLVRHYHFGEGEYSESERVIQALLAEGTNQEFSAETLNIDGDEPPISRSQTPETYLGYERSENFLNEAELVEDEISTYTLSENLDANEWSIGGEWEVKGKDLISRGNSNVLKLNYSAKEVYLVMGAQVETQVVVKNDGKNVIENSLAGEDVNEKSEVIVKEPTLYRLINSPEFVRNGILELLIPSGVTLNAFTFGS